MEETLDVTVFVWRHKYQQVFWSGGGNCEVMNCGAVVGSVGCLHEAMPVLRLRCPRMFVGASGVASCRQRQMVRALRRRAVVGLDGCRLYARKWQTCYRSTSWLVLGGILWGNFVKD
jgi:hypothetical protein